MRTQIFLPAELYYIAPIPRYSSLSNLGISTASITIVCRTRYPRVIHSLRHVLCPKESTTVSKGSDTLLHEIVITENKSKGSKYPVQTRGPRPSPVLLVQRCSHTRISTSRHRIFQISFSPCSGVSLFQAQLKREIA